MNEMRKLMEAIEKIDEAYEGGKTEHSGAKKGKGAFYGPKKEAKRDSNKNRRRAGKAAVKEEPGDFDHGYNYEGPQAGDYSERCPKCGVDLGGIRNGTYCPKGCKLTEDDYNNEPGATKYTQQYGNVTVDFDDDEVLVTHGHGENIFLTIDEWNEFVGELKDT